MSHEGVEKQVNVLSGFVRDAVVIIESIRYEFRCWWRRRGRRKFFFDLFTSPCSKLF